MFRDAFFLLSAGWSCLCRRHFEKIISLRIWRQWSVRKSGGLLFQRISFRVMLLFSLHIMVRLDWRWTTHLVVSGSAGPTWSQRMFSMFHRLERWQQQIETSCREEWCSPYGKEKGWIVFVHACFIFRPSAAVSRHGLMGPCTWYVSSSWGTRTPRLSPPPPPRRV